MKKRFVPEGDLGRLWCERGEPRFPQLVERGIFPPAAARTGEEKAAGWWLSALLLLPAEEEEEAVEARERSEELELERAPAEREANWED